MLELSKSKRASGILLHITSLPSRFGIGDLGPESYRFVDLLSSQGQRYWSILPLSPTRLKDGNSPYNTSSVFAGNPLLISPELLCADGFLLKADLEVAYEPVGSVDFASVYKSKSVILNKAYQTFKRCRLQYSLFNSFCATNSGWLDDYALYVALRQETGKPWYEWLPSIRKREPKVLVKKRLLLSEEIEREKFRQYLFFSQWGNFKRYCKTREIFLIGDIPFYVAHDSADLWVYPSLFNLYGNGKPISVGGVPPDYFSATGQLWGNPTYNWLKHKETGFEWWLNRIRHNLTLCDLLRLDHFRGFVAYWQVSSLANTAINGRWVKGPSNAFFSVLKTCFPSLPFIAEDLGYIDKSVEKALKFLGVPGMKVVLFGLDGSKNNPHVLSNHVANSVVFTGTHDTNTVQGWFATEASKEERATLMRLIGKKVTMRDLGLEVVKLAMSSISNVCVIPLQDVLGLGSEARMNDPSRPFGNWCWRVTEHQIKSNKLCELGELTINYLRC